MRKHPNEFSQRQILKFFFDRDIRIEIKGVENGYVVFFHRFSFIEACIIDDPAGRVLYDASRGEWSLYWMSSNFRWHLYDCFERLDQALEAMFSDKAASLFHKVL